MKTCVFFETADANVLPWFAPAASVLDSTWAKSLALAVVASPAALPEGGWKQARMFEKGLATDPFLQTLQYGDWLLPPPLVLLPIPPRIK